LVPGAGIEPARPYGQQILSLLRLPFRHPGKRGFYTGQHYTATMPAKQPAAAAIRHLKRHRAFGSRHLRSGRMTLTGGDPAGSGGATAVFGGELIGGGGARL